MSDLPASRMPQTFQSSVQPAAQQLVQPSSDDAIQPTPQPQPAVLNNQQKLATFEAILSEMQEEKQQTAPEVSPPVQQVPDGSISYSTSGVHKEQAPGVVVNSAELPGGLQYIESEPNPEIPAEVESFLQKVEENTAQLPQEIVIAAQQHAAQTPRALPQDVKILPITLAQEVEGKKKSTAFSIKWLVTFSTKLAEMFKGKAVYRTE